MEEFDVVETEIARRLQEYEAEWKKNAKCDKEETIELPDIDSSEHTSEGLAQAAKDEQP